MNLAKVCVAIMAEKSADPDFVNYLKALAPFSNMISTSDRTYARLFKLFSSDASLDTIIPFSIIDDCLKCLDLKAGFGNLLRKFCPEFSNVMALHKEDGIALLKYCEQRVIDIHKDDLVPEAPTVCSPYNPAKYGRAYYFHAHGNKIREMRKFSVDGKTSSFDDVPYEYCSKNYPMITKKGISYLFLWFCPTHGHCYGFHIIPASEGRKDPAASLYTHLENAPDSIVYDFACSLSEYCHNRESGYFAKMRFFHDVFHSYNHKCSASFRCQRLKSFTGVNSSICEQFNSFLQNIKTSARLMSQVHFTFYVQFFISIWNGNKRKPLQACANILNETLL